jgi:uncharacterized protein (TIRG00374 family)
LKSKLTTLFTSSYFRLGLGVAVSAGSLYLAAREVDLREVWDSLTQVNLMWVTLALVSVATNMLGRTLRWRLLLGDAGCEIPLSKLLVSLLLGMMLNMLLPARVGDVSRAYAVGGLGPGRTYTLGTVALEKILDLFAFAVLFLALLVLMPLPDWVDSSAYTLAALALVFLLLLALLTYQRVRVKSLLERVAQWFPEQMSKWIIERMRLGLASLDVLETRRALIQLAFWSTVVWGTGLLTNHLTLLALQIQLPLTASLLILVVLQFGISIPSVPGRIGVFEYLCVLALSVFGVAQSLGLTYGILLHFLSVFPMILSGPLSVWILGPARGRPNLIEVSEEIKP